MADFKLWEFSSVLLAEVFLVFALSLWSIRLLFLDTSVYSASILILLRIVLALFVVCAMLAIYKLVIGVRIIRNPVRYLFSRTEPVRRDNPIYTMVDKIRKSEGIAPIQLMCSNEVPVVFSVGNPLGKMAIIFAPSVLEKLDDGQLNAVLLHEMYHILNDLKMQSLNVIEDVLLHKPLPIVPFTLLILLISLGFPGFESTPKTIFGPTFDEVFNWLSSFATILFIELIVVVAVIMARKVRKEGRMSADYLYVRELLADAFSLFKSGNAQKLRNALLECENIMISKLGFLGRIENSERKIRPTLKELFKTQKFTVGLKNLKDALGVRKWYLKQECPLNARLSLIDEIEKLRDEHAVLKIVRDDYLLGDQIASGLPPLVHKYLKENRDNFGRFLVYVKDHFSKFNLVECSSSLGIEEFEAFLMLVGAIEMELVNFARLSPKVKRLKNF